MEFLFKNMSFFLYIRIKIIPHGKVKGLHFIVLLMLIVYKTELNVKDRFKPVATLNPYSYHTTSP